jgi:hypothetical protein
MSVVNDALVATEDSAPIAFQLGNSRSGAIGAKLSGKVLNSLLQQAAGPNMVHGGRAGR